MSPLHFSVLLLLKKDQLELEAIVLGDWWEMWVKGSP